jgi:hypothetical protein
MTKGATIVIIPEGLATFPVKLIEYLKDQKVDWIFWVPTIMVNIANLDLVSALQLPDLKNSVVCRRGFSNKAFKLLAQVFATCNVCELIRANRNYIRLYILYSRERFIQ